MTKKDQAITIPHAIDKLDGNKKLVMQAYRELRGNVTLSCQTCEVSRGTFYLWMQDDKDFRAAKEEADAELNDEIRDVLVTKAGEADMTAVIFYLKSRHPDFKPQPYAAAEFKDGDKSIRFVVQRE